MLEPTGAHNLLGRPDAGELILLAGPSYEHMLRMTADAGMPVQDIHYVLSIEALKESARKSGRSEVLLGSLSEVEGILDRSAFDTYTEAAYLADRVVYAGTTADVLVWPLPTGSRLEVRGGKATMYLKTVPQSA